jgi:hypothetical protein
MSTCSPALTRARSGWGLSFALGVGPGQVQIAGGVLAYADGLLARVLGPGLGRFRALLGLRLAGLRGRGVAGLPYLGADALGLGGVLFDGLASRSWAWRARACSAARRSLISSAISGQVANGRSGA